MANQGKQGPREVRGEGVIGLFAARLRAARLSRGMTQVDLSREAGVTATYVGKLEGARVAPGIDLVARLAEALGLDAGALLAGPPPDPLPVYRAQAEALMKTLLGSARLDTYLFLNPLLAGLVEAVGKGEHQGNELKG